METENIIRNAMEGIWQVRETARPIDEAAVPPKSETSGGIVDIYILSAQPTSERTGLTLLCQPLRCRIRGRKIVMATRSREDSLKEGQVFNAVRSDSLDVRLDAGRVEVTSSPTAANCIFEGDELRSSHEGVDVISERVKKLD